MNIFLDNKNIKEICLVGYYGFGNIGDDAILLSAINEYIKAYDLYVRVLVNEQDYIYKMLEFFELDGSVNFYNRWKVKEISEAIYYSDAVIFGGGGLFQDKTSFRSFLYYFFIALLAKIKNKKIIIERNSIGPISRKISKFLFSKVIQWAEYISVRDSLSLEFLLSNYPSFSEKYQKKEDFTLSYFSSELFSKLISSTKKIDCLFILRESKNINKIFEIIKILRESFKIKVIVFQEEDLDLFADLVDFFEIEYPGKGEIFRTLEFIQSSKLVVSNRLHGIILALQNNVKTIAISVDPKIEGFCKDYNIEFHKEEDLEANWQNLKTQIENYISDL